MDKILSDVELDSVYTLEQFESYFDLADNLVDKNNVISKAIDNLDLSSLEVKKALLRFHIEVKYYKLEMNKEMDATCNRDIESGSFELYKCIKSIDNYVEGFSYYVKVDDVKSKYTEALGEVPDSMKEYIDSIKPLTWIISDNGIGTLKTKNIFLEKFSNYFQK